MKFKKNHLLSYYLSYLWGVEALNPDTLVYSIIFGPCFVPIAGHPSLIIKKLSLSLKEFSCQTTFIPIFL